VPAEAVFAAPRAVERLEECLFYHTMDLPGLGTVEGQWDLRRGLDDYLGHTSFAGVRVLDVGTASGFLCFAIEHQGAEVVGYDLSPDYDWDVVPFAGTRVDLGRTERKELIRRLNNSFWLAHRIFASSARMVYGSVYSMPSGMGTFDFAILGSILLHLRDPFQALEQAAGRTSKGIVVSEPLPRRSLLIPALARWFGPSALFLPDPRRGEPRDSWWSLSPRAVAQMLGVVGFPNHTVTYHSQQHLGTSRRMFTIVATR
jgi:SAM-dependent methyltransferase